MVNKCGPQAADTTQSQTLNEDSPPPGSPGEPTTKP
jgi:hypothetical protein